MVHLEPLPGSPRFDGDLERIVGSAQRDAETLQTVGFDAICVENFGDAPFFADTVPAVTVAAMTRMVGEVRSVCSLPVGVNVLRNDGEAGLAIAAASGCSFIRVNVLAGVMFTDQGIIEGRSADIARLRRQLDVDTAVYADVFVKHATAPPGSNIEDAATNTWQRGGADALIVTGTATGLAADLEQASVIKKLLPDAPVIVGSGVTPTTVAEVLAVADGVIVGTSIKEDQVTTNAVSLERAEAMVAAASA